ncbi:MAG: putative fibronectin type III-like fold domain [Bacteroidota bacterium]|jgi:hypothetical protein
MKKMITFSKSLLLVLILLISRISAFATTETISTFSSTSGNIGTNVSYASFQGGGTTAPAINTSQIRLYQNAAGTGGGYITVSVPAGYKISEASIQSGMTTTVAYSIDGSGNTKLGSAALSTTGTYTQSSLNASSITFHCMGNSSTTRLYVKYLSVTYDAVTTSAPSTQASALNFTSIGQTGLTANWTSGDGAKRVVIVNTSNSFTAPTDGTDPTANTVYGGSGEQVVYNGTGTSVAVTGLTASTTYYFRVYEYNGSSSTTKYLTTTATNNPNSQITNAASTPTISVVGTINAFANTVINTTSAEQSYTLQGANLTGNVTVTPPAGFEISKTSGSGFVANPSTLTFTPAEIASAQNVYVRFAPTAAQAYSGNITHTSTGATQVDKALSGTGIKAEPTNHPTGLTATANSSTQITVTWTDATGGQTPDGYLVKASATSPTAPSDGTAETDATLVKNIAQGTQTAVFTGLSASTTYNFSIWPYTNSGSSINYKTDGTIPTASAITQAPPSIKWDGGASTTAWSDAANWSGDAVPGSTDIVVLDNSLVSGSYSVVLPSGNIKTTILKLTISPTLPNTITLTLSAANTYGATNDAGLVVGDNTASTDDIIINEGGVLINASGASTGNGIQVNALANGTLRINNGGKFVHNTTRSAAGTSVATILSTVSGTEKGIFEYDIPGTGSYGLGASGRTYGSLTLTRSAGAATVTSSGSGELTIKGDFVINSGVTYSSSMTGAMNVGGNITNNGAILTIPSGQAVNLNGTSTQLVSGTNKITFAGTTTIASGATISLAPTFGLTVTGALTNNGTIILQSNATGTATLLTPASISGSGTATVQQFLTGVTGSAGRGWWYVSSPISNATSAVFNLAGNVYKFGYWDEPTFSYPQISDNATSLTTGKGYIFYNPTADATFSFSGTLNTGDITINPTRTGTVDGARGFNLVGNPYPSFLDWNAATKTNVRNTIWYRTWSAGGSMTFDTFDGTVGTGNGSNGTVNRYIPPMQAFWVKVNADGDAGAITFHNADRSHQDQTNSNNRLKTKSSENSTIVRLRVSNGTNSDEAILVGDVNASNAFDNYDSPKMKVNNSEIPELYSIADQQELVINHLNSITNNTELPLGFRPGKTASFTISATEISNLDSNLKVILKDNNTEYELSNGNSYSFSSDATATNSRFSILFKSNGAVTSTENKKVNNIIISSSNNEISIITDGDSNNNAKATVYNSIGKEVKTLNLKPGINRLSSISTGVYIVQINTNTSTSEHKVVIK